MDNIKRGDSIFGVFWVCFGIVISIWSATFPFGSLAEPGPSYFPLGCGLILVLLGSIMFIGARASKVQGSQQESSGTFLPDKAARKRTILTVTGILLSVIALEPLGFILTVFFMILFLVIVVKPQMWKMALFYAFICSVAFYTLFKMLLKTQLPSGIMGF